MLGSQARHYHIRMEREDAKLPRDYNVPTFVKFTIPYQNRTRFIALSC